MIPKVLLAFALTLLAAPAFAAIEPFAPGQTWVYTARPDQAGSRVCVLRIEDYPKIGRVVHVSIVGLALRRKPDGAPEGWNIAHAAFGEATLRNSVLQLDPSPAKAPEAAEKTYQQWKKEADRGNVQRWTIPVADAVTQIERWIREGRG
jgi:hypothetical protein